MNIRKALLGSVFIGAAMIGGSAAQAQSVLKPQSPPQAPGSTSPSTESTVAGPVTAPPSGADSTAAADGSTVGEVIVTATRRKTNLETTGAAITALGADTLRDRNVATFEDLGRVAPAVQVSTSEGFAQVYIRGIGTPLRGAGLGEGSTALLTDGVYLSNAADGATVYYDVDRIEVLRGPQGTLYGRNATSGAVNVITKGPTDDFEAEGRIIAGNYNRFTESGAVSGPIYGDMVKGRLAFIKNDHDGYETLIYPDGSKSDAENQHDLGVRGKVEIDPVQNLTVLLTGDYFHADDRAVDYHYFGPGFVGSAPYEARLATSTFISTPDSRTQYTNVPNFYNKRDIGGISANIKYNWNGYTLTSISAYRRLYFQYQNDLGFGTTQTATQHHGENAHQWTEDVILASPAGKFFDWLAGFSYFEQNNRLLVNYFIPTAGAIGSLSAKQAPLFNENRPSCCILDLSGSFNNSAYAGFLDFNFNITDKLKLHAGGRYTSEEIGGSQHVGVADGPTFVGFNVVPELASKSFDSFTPKAGVDYRFTPDIFAYFSYTKGFKSGGYNIGDFSQNQPFNPEKIDSYEGGLKTQWLERRLTLNATGFDYEYSNLQVQQTINNSVQILNAATAEVYGGEFEGAFRPAPLTQIDASVVLLHARFTQFNTQNPNRTALGILDLAGRPLPKAPDFSLDIGVQQGFPLGDKGVVTIRGDYSHKSTAYQDIYGEPGLTQGPTDLLGARLSFAPNHGKWDVAVFVQNLTDTKFRTNAFYGGGVIGSEALGQLNPPRTFGVELGVKF